MSTTYAAASTAANQWRIAARRAGTHALAVVPLVVLGFLIVFSLRKHALAFDLVHAYLPAAHSVVHGLSPFPPLTLRALDPRTAFVYPPLTAWLIVPFAALPLAVAELTAVALMVGALAGLLLLLGVRDWRCYMVALLWVPTFSAIQTANMNLPIALAVGALWRFRARPAVAGVLFGLLVALKLYLWPLGVWLIATRRYRAAATGTATAALLVVASWAPTDFAGLRSYPRLLAMLTRAERGDGYSLGALLAPLLSWPVATAVGILCGLLVLACSWRSARRGEEQRALIYAIAALLMLTPIVWMNYFVLLLVVIALSAQTFTPLWTLPLALWVAPQVSNGRPWQTAAALALVAGTIVAAARTGPRAPRPTGVSPSALRSLVHSLVRARPTGVLSPVTGSPRDARS